MKRFLEKLKLIEYLRTELEIQKNDFIINFKKNVDQRKSGYNSVVFDSFSSSKNEYEGYVGNENFKIKRRSRFLDYSKNFAIAQGKYSQHGSSLIIETVINGFSRKMIPYYVLLIVIYSIFILTSFMSEDMQKDGQGIFATFVFIHAIFMFYMPYLMMRRSTKRMKHELEREFYYMTKK